MGQTIKFTQFLNEIQKNTPLEYSLALTDLISSSGDIAGSPFYHWRWKEKSLPDIVVWPQSTDDVVYILNLAQKYHISITTRGGGTGYFGGAAPTTGGILLDMKRMNKIQLNSDKSIVSVQAGVSFGKLLQILHRNHYTLSTFPTSALGATIGGWIGTGGKMGIGTWQYGAFQNQILEMTVVSIPFGKKKYLNSTEFGPFLESYGILGIVTEISLSIIPIVPYQLISFAFQERNNIFQSIDGFKKLASLNTIYISSNPNRLALLFKTQSESYEKDMILLEEYSNLYGLFQKELKPLSELNSDLYNLEIKNKKDYPVLLLQHLLLPISKVAQLIDYLDLFLAKYQLQMFWALIPNKDGFSRLTLSSPTDNQFWEHFLASKGLLHKLSKTAYTLSGRIYSYELQNSFFLGKYEENKLKSYIQLKIQFDSSRILNPLKITESKMSFSRINTMFELALLWRRLKILIRKAETPAFLNPTSNSKIDNNCK